MLERMQTGDDEESYESYGDPLYGDGPAEASVFGDGNPNQLIADLVEVVFCRLADAFWACVFFPLRLFIRGELRRGCAVLEDEQEIPLLHEINDETPATRLMFVVDFLISLCAFRVRRVRVLVDSVVSLFAFGSHFLLIWLLTRQYGRLKPAVPAILLAGVVTVFALAATWVPPRNLAVHYRDSVAKAIEVDDFATAILCYQKLEQLEPNSHIGAFNAALLLAQEGNLDEAFRRMQVLAPKQGFGFVPAHLWIAHALVTESVSCEQDDLQELISFHLKHVLRREPGNEFAVRMLAEQQAKEGDTEGALGTLEQMLTRDLETKLDRDMQAADIHMRSGELAAANRIWKESANAFDELFESGESFSTQGYTNWAFAHGRSGNRVKAIRALQRGIEQHPTNDDMVATYHAECESLMRTRGLTSVFQIDGHFQTLKRLLDSNPNDEMLLVQLADAHAIPSLRNEAERLLTARMKNATLPLLVYERLASLALSRGESEEAIRLYRLVLKEDSERPSSLNNLAWVLSHEESPDCEYALSLVNKAISLDADSALLRGTRGHILVQLSRWRDAIKDLEIAVNGSPRHGELHHALLAKAHKELGHKELSDMHRGLSLLAVRINGPMPKSNTGI